MNRQVPKIRIASPDDIMALAVLDEDIFGQLSYRAFVFRQFIEIFSNGVIAAEMSGILTGYIVAMPVANACKGWILSLGVLSDYRGMGVGTQLLNAGIDALASVQIESVHLTVEPENTGAVELYKRHGFENADLVDNYFGNGEKRLKMLKLLTSRRIKKVK